MELINCTTYNMYKQHLIWTEGMRVDWTVGWSTGYKLQKSYRKDLDVNSGPTRMCTQLQYSESRERCKGRECIDARRPLRTVTK